jgi:hypothetical protein
MPTNADKILDFPVNGNAEQDEWRTKPPTAELVRQRAREQFDRILGFLDNEARALSFHEVETKVVALVFALGRLLLAFFLARRGELLALPPFEVLDDVWYERRHRKSRRLGTFFGKVRYWRMFMAGPAGGYYPLDYTLKLPTSSFSLLVTSLMSRLATKMSYAQARLVFGLHLGWAPSTTSFERAVLGLGRHTAAWVEQAPVPPGDGEVLVFEADAKAAPTATDEELKRRRGKRRKQRFPDSPRHRARANRLLRGSKRRRKKGDKSKNGRAANVAVMFTLKEARDSRGRRYLKGPINRRIYASFAPKEHVFAMARRLADRRGFTVESGKRVQFLSDGDERLAALAKKYFPNATLSLDVVHAIEYVWQAGECFLKEGSSELLKWMTEQKKRLYNGQVQRLLRELRDRLRAIPKTGPGNKGRRQRLAASLTYLRKRAHMMNYKTLRSFDLEIGTGAVEGAVRYVVAQRFDNSGMRWIRERAEPLLQLRCIEINGEWDAFIQFVHETVLGAPRARAEGAPLLAAQPAPLPTLGREAAS